MSQNHSTHLPTALRKVAAPHVKAAHQGELSGPQSLMDHIESRSGAAAVATLPLPYVMNEMGNDAATTLTAIMPLVFGAMSLEKNIQKFPINPILAYTFVAFASSAPELASSTAAGLAGQPGLGIGNVVGSNITNTMLVGAAGMLIAGAQRIQQSDVGIHNQTALASTMLFAGLYGTGNLNEYTGAGLATLGLGYTAYNVAKERWGNNGNNPISLQLKDDMYEEFYSVYVNGDEDNIKTIVDRYFTLDEQRSLFKELFPKQKGKVKDGSELTADQKHSLGERIVDRHETIFVGMVQAGEIDLSKQRGRQYLIELYDSYLQRSVDIRRLQEDWDFDNQLNSTFRKNSKELRNILEQSGVYKQKDVEDVLEACSPDNFLKVLKETPVLEGIDPASFKDIEQVQTLYEGFLHQRAIAASIQIEAVKNEVTLKKLNELEKELGFEFSRDFWWEIFDTQAYGVGFEAFSKSIKDLDAAVKKAEIKAGEAVNSEYLDQLEDRLGMKLTEHMKNDIVRYCDARGVTQEFLNEHIEREITAKQNALGAGGEISEEVIDEFFELFEMTVTPEQKENLLKTFAGAGIGAATLITAADFLVKGGVGWSENVESIDPETVGLVVVAIGTSLPEFASVVTNAIKTKKLDAMWGVVLGSNTFNALAVGSVIGFTANGVQAEKFLWDNPNGLAQTAILAASSLAIYSIARGGHSRRSYGAGLLGAFAAYTAFNIMGGGDLQAVKDLSNTVNENAAPLLEHFLPS